MPPVTQRNSRHLVGLGEATRTWGLISIQTFGGPAGQIAMMHRILVEQKRWLGERRFLHALNYCMLLPGPEAQQLAIYAGWLLNGWLGGIIAGVLFVLPGVVALLALSWVYVTHGDTQLVAGLFLGLAPAVLAIVAYAVWRLRQRVLHHRLLLGIAVAAFVALALFGVPFPVVVLAAGLIGWWVHRRWPDLIPESGHAAAGDGPQPLVPDDALHSARPSRRRNTTILSLGLVLWAAPVLVAVLWAGRQSVFVEQGLFFAFTALVTFGGAYAVLSFVAQQAVGVFGWLTGGEMVKGLALAESTPGPLIMVVQFVAFLGAYRSPGGLDPVVAGVLASLLVTWVTFVPCFLFILLGAPYVERLRGNTTITAALGGVTAAVVGVIANLAVYFASHTLFAQTREVVAGPLQVELPVLTSFQAPAAAIAVLALLLVFWRGWSTLRVLGLCALLGVGVGLLG
ncbi:chromate efflux transporter [Nocardioides limicola]|uniref:chromate efflux transporter n=1 Tax=Nocardioides limicola TaxID=2803368 RepID=UPI00193C6A21